MKSFNVATKLAALAAPMTAILLVMAAGTASAATKDQEALLQMERDSAKAIVSGDVKFIEALEADELVITNPDGSTNTKAEDLAGYKSGKTKVVSAAVSDMDAIVIGDTGVVVGRMDFNGMYQGQSYVGAYRFTDTYVKRDGHWRQIATHASEIAKK
jgi:ketosteroid isomerase-like protein